MYVFDDKSVERLRKVVREYERSHKNPSQRPKRREFHPTTLKLVKLKSGETLTSGSGDSADCEVWTGDPGSETDSGDEVTIYGGRLLQGGDGLSAGDWAVVGPLNGRWQLLGRGGSGGTSSFRMVLFSLDETLTRATETADATVVSAWGDGTLPEGSITVRNPEAASGYWYAAPSGNHGLGVWNGTEYTILRMEPVLVEPLTDLQVDAPELQVKSRPIYVDQVEDESEWDTVHTGTTC